MDEQMNNQITDENIFRAWTGKKDEFYYKVNNKKFNFCAFFFGVYYFFYRRMYLVGVIALAINIICNVLINFFTNITKSPISVALVGMIFGIIINLIYGFTFYPIYKWNYRRKIGKLKMYGASNEELLKYAKEKGGVSWSLIIVLLLLPAIIYILMLAFGMSMIIGLGPNSIYNAAMNQKNNTTSIYSDVNGTTTSSNKVVLDNDYSINIDTTKWEDVSDINKYDSYFASVKKSFRYRNNGILNILMYGGSEYINKSYYDFNVYDDMLKYKNIITEQLQKSNTNTSQISGTYLLNKNDTYYIEIDVKNNEENATVKIYFVFDKNKNKVLSFLIMSNNSYIDYSINNEILNAITSI